MPKDYKRAWTPERRAKFAETMKLKASKKSPSPAESGPLPPQTSNITPQTPETGIDKLDKKTTQKPAELGVQEVITLDLPGKWTSRYLGDGITIYASFDQRLHFYTDPKKKSNVRVILETDNGAKLTVENALVCKVTAVQIAHPTKSIHNWPQEINFQEWALKNLTSKQCEKA